MPSCRKLAQHSRLLQDMQSCCPAGRQHSAAGCCRTCSHVLLQAVSTVQCMQPQRQWFNTDQGAACKPFAPTCCMRSCAGKVRKYARLDSGSTLSTAADTCALACGSAEVLGSSPAAAHTKSTTWSNTAWYRGRPAAWMLTFLYATAEASREVVLVCCSCSASTLSCCSLKLRSRATCATQQHSA